MPLTTCTSTLFITTQKHVVGLELEDFHGGGAGLAEESELTRKAAAVSAYLGESAEAVPEVLAAIVAVDIKQHSNAVAGMVSKEFLCQSGNAGVNRLNARVLSELLLYGLYLGPDTVQYLQHLNAYIAVV